LTHAGCGIAVGNADPGVLPVARRVTVTNDEDAVAVVLREILAGQEPGHPNPLYEPSTHTG
ncbi:MAG: HAD family hydrolase, partial [Chloroflexota bacterium]